MLVYYSICKFTQKIFIETIRYQKIQAEDYRFLGLSEVF